MRAQDNHSIKGGVNLSLGTSFLKANGQFGDLRRRMMFFFCLPQFRFQDRGFGFSWPNHLFSANSGFLSLSFSLITPTPKLAKKLLYRRESGNFPEHSWTFCTSIFTRWLHKKSKGNKASRKLFRIQTHYLNVNATKWHPRLKCTTIRKRKSWKREHETRNPW